MENIIRDCERLPLDHIFLHLWVVPALNCKPFRNLPTDVVDAIIISACQVASAITSPNKGEVNHDIIRYLLFVAFTRRLMSSHLLTDHFLISALLVP